MKRLYVVVMRVLRALASKSGFLEFLEKRTHRPLFLYLRSLFSIYDVDDMIRLDVPWWTFEATRHVEKFLRERGGAAEVFEYGPGASTVWLARRARRVAYVEHDERFMAVLERSFRGLENVSGTLSPPARRPRAEIACGSGCKGYRGLDFTDYVRSIRDAGGPFDLIVIDGRARVSCLQEALSQLKPDGIILFDNSVRRRYRGAIDGAGLSRDRFRGPAPALPYCEETTLLRAQPEGGAR